MLNQFISLHNKTLLDDKLRNTRTRNVASVIHMNDLILVEGSNNEAFTSKMIGLFSDSFSDVSKLAILTSLELAEIHFDKKPQKPQFRRCSRKNSKKK